MSQNATPSGRIARLRVSDANGISVGGRNSSFLRYVKAGGARAHGGQHVLHFSIDDQLKDVLMRQLRSFSFHERTVPSKAINLV